MAWTRTPLRPPQNLTISDDPFSENYYSFTEMLAPPVVKTDPMPSDPWFAIASRLLALSVRVSGSWTYIDPNPDFPVTFLAEFDGYQTISIPGPSPDETAFNVETDPPGTTAPNILLSLLQEENVFEAGKIIGSFSYNDPDNAVTGDVEFYNVPVIHPGDPLGNAADINTSFGYDLSSGLFGASFGLYVSILARVTAGTGSAFPIGSVVRRITFFTKNNLPISTFLRETGTHTLRIPDWQNPGAFLTKTFPTLAYIVAGLEELAVDMLTVPLGQSDDPDKPSPVTGAVLPWSPTGSETDPLRKWNQDATSENNPKTDP